MKHDILHMYVHYTLLITVVLSCTLRGRSIYRPTIVPQIITRWVDEDTQYHLQHNNLEAPSIFDQYNEDEFQKHLLPDATIVSRDGTTTIAGTILKQLLEEVVAELQSSTKYQFRNKNFTVLKQRDYNPKTHSGLIVLKFKEYPFVVKIFMETPQSFVTPFSKGFEPCCFFVMSGGTSRYLLGFTRIRNREAIQRQLESDPHWGTKISTPRKWFWRPENTRWFEVTSKNLGPCDRTTTFPAVYAIVCDAIEADSFQMTNSEDRKTGIELSHLFGTKIDSHIDNFLIERSSGNFIIIDTEHFATQVGLRQPMDFDGYFSWYWQLSKKCIGNCFFRMKKERLFYQQNPPQIIKT